MKSFFNWLKNLFKVEVKPVEIEVRLSKREIIYNTALAEHGVKELRGKNHNRRILEYLETVGGFITDETAWCAAFANWVLKKCEINGTGKAHARSFLLLTNGYDWEEVSIQDAKKGDIVVFWRESIQSWKGHVAFFSHYDGGDNVEVLGGNQRNKVCILDYPTYRILKIIRYVK